VQQKAARALPVCNAVSAQPGVVVAAKALIEHNPNPTEEQARYWLAGNLCRCTGYDKIIRAVLDAAQQMREEAAV
jgi:carbon-monoxide dehydrogenase small subunit